MFPALCLAARAGAVTLGPINHLNALEPWNMEKVRLGPGTGLSQKQKWQGDQVLYAVVLTAPCLSTVSCVDSTDCSVQSCIWAAVVSSPEQSTYVNLDIIHGYLVLTLDFQPGSLFFELHSIL